MSLLSQLKSVVEELPESIGRPLSRVPFTLRLGPSYASFVCKLKTAEANPSRSFEQFVAPDLSGLLADVAVGCPFYEEFYRQHGYRPSTIQSLENWQCVPIVTKADLQTVPMKQRSFPGRKGMKINTGGTSGQPLEFCLDKKAFAREWAHMHFPLCQGSCNPTRC
jgi:phenylacetate-CoA ligase